MKRMRTAVIAAVLLGVLAVGAAAASGIQQILVDLRPDITVEVDGMARTMTDKNGKTVYPISYDGTTYLPVRALGEILGQTVEWDSATQTVIMTEKVLEPAALYPTVDDLEKGMTRSEKAIDGLTPADTYVERAKQYAALVGDLDDLRAGLDALVEETNSDFSAGKLTLAEFTDLNNRLGAVDVRLKDAYTDLETKTIADETGKLTAYQISANNLTELEAAMTELEQAIEAFKPAPTTVEQAQSYAALSLRLENLYEQISAGTRPSTTTTSRTALPTLSTTACTAGPIPWTCGPRTPAPTWRRRTPPAARPIRWRTRSSRSWTAAPLPWSRRSGT